MNNKIVIRIIFYALMLIILGIYIYLYQYKNDDKSAYSYHDIEQSIVLPNIDIGGEFTLTNPDGKAINSSSFLSKYQLIYFGYTYCPDICPTELYTISQAVDILEKKSIPVQPIFITIDPERDTKELLKRYSEMFHPQLIALTGTEKEINEVAKKFRVYFKKEHDASSNSYLVDHTTFIYAFDPKGNMLTIFRHGTSEQEIADTITNHYKKR